ncbi:unnamed protein product [Clonostachys solani]|uniref:Uncharacterized protein n=1 Tax=Clonostachys solani TaxID=160281 RepID=A0A9N9VXI6_9HYPO|nr:unnamed protein product [Clonostachys solani]
MPSWILDNTRNPFTSNSMDADTSLPGSPVGGPLRALTPDRVNQRDSVSSVHDKISQFNSMSIAMQSKQMERKTADAALKRAIIGREEAEVEAKRCKEEVNALRRAVDEGKERERRVGERLETVMENYGRAKETHAHTQTLWEKEIRRARKETFKTQSSFVKIQEELKAARGSVKTLEESVEREKERSRIREQEAFSARYELVGIQEQLEQVLAQMKVVEQERDAIRTVAKNEEIARIAAEGRIPLPPCNDPNDEFASPPKKTQKKRKISRVEPRYSLSTMEIESSAASELEIEDLTMQVQWERQRADRAEEMVEFLKAECKMHCCQCSKSKSKSRSSIKSRQGSVHGTPEVALIQPIPEEQAEMQVEAPSEEPQDQEPEPEQVEAEAVDVAPESQLELATPKAKKGPRLSTIFCPREGIFRTVSEQEAEAMQAQEAQQDAEMETEPVSASASDHDEEPHMAEEEEHESDPRMYARTPSVEPPSFALLTQERERASLMSLLNAPHTDAHHAVPSIPTVPDLADIEEARHSSNQDETRVNDESDNVVEPLEPLESPEPRPHTSATLYTVTTTTTVPVRDETAQRESSSSFNEKLRTPSSGSHASFDSTNPALTPTMTREQALAKIRERRGRARSAAQGAATPHKKMLQGKDRRDMSAPTGRVGSKSRV